jgi:hypothetical protein
MPLSVKIRALNPWKSVLISCFLNSTPHRSQQFRNLDHCEGDPRLGQQRVVEIALDDLRSESHKEIRGANQIIE